MPRSTGKNSRLLTAGSLLGLTAVWWTAAAIVGREIILPGPPAVLRALIGLLARRDFWFHLSATILRGLGGFSLSYAAGMLLGLACGLSRPLDVFFRPLLVAVRSTPSMAIILLALIWFRSGTVAIFVTFLLVFPLVSQDIAEGIRGIDRELVEMARVYCVSRLRRLSDLYLPAILPYMAAGATNGLGLTWKVTIAAEVLAGPHWGIGARMDAARVYLNTSEVFAWTVVVVLIGYLCDRALEILLQKKMLSWK